MHVDRLHDLVAFLSGQVQQIQAQLVDTQNDLAQQQIQHQQLLQQQQQQALQHQEDANIDPNL
jgi:hypothetical protein